MANKILRGNDLMIFKDTTGAGTAYKALAFSTSCQLSLTGNTLETSSKDGGKWTSKANLFTFLCSRSYNMSAG